MSLLRSSMSSYVHVLNFHVLGPQRRLMTQVEGLVGTFLAARDALETLMRVYLFRLPPTQHNRAN